MPEDTDGFITDLRLLQQQNRHIEKKLDSFVTLEVYQADQRTTHERGNTVLSNTNALVQRVTGIEDTQKWLARLIVGVGLGMVASVLMALLNLVLK